MASSNDLRIKKHMETCSHFTGIQHDKCKAGVNIRALVGGPDLGWATRLPCLVLKANKCEVTCAERKFPTREEAAKDVAAAEECMKRTLLALRLAHEDAKLQGLGRGNGGRGQIPCPTGCGGTLRYTVASYNGHMHGDCETSGCVSWME